MRTLGLALLLSLSFSAAANARPLVVRGSEAMFPLGKAWADSFMQNADVNVQVFGGGATPGLRSLISGSADVCLSIRRMRPNEREALRTRHATLGVEIPVARKAITIYVNAKSPIRSLTVSQVRGIFTGAITNWKDLGGEDESISVLTRDPFSESYALFRETVLGNQEVTLRSLPAGGNLAVIGAVARNRSAIGFGSLADPKRLHGVKAVAIQADDGTTPILPVAAAIEQGTYPLTRTMYLYLRNRPAGATKALVDWILSPDGQVHVASTDCFRER